MEGDVERASGVARLPDILVLFERGELASGEGLTVEVAVATGAAGISSGSG